MTDVAHAEKVEAELDAFVEKRAREAKDAATIEELWAESARAHRRKLQRRNGLAWIAFHEHMCQQFRALADEHRARAEKVLAAVEQLGED